MSNELPPPPLRVLHMTLAMSRGGRRDAILALAKAGRKAGLCPHLATLRAAPETGSLGEFDSESDLGIHRLPSLADLRRLAQLCHTLKIDIVHTHDASSQYVASLLHCVAPMLRVVMTYHRTLDIESIGFRNKLRNTITLPLVAKVVTTTQERREHFLRLNSVRASKVVIIPLGIDTVRFRPDSSARAEIRRELGLPDSVLLLVAAGHFGPEKGIDQVIEAVGRSIPLAAADQVVHLAVLGTGTPEQVRMITAVGDRWLRGRIAFLGFRSDPERVFAAADLLVHLPRLESFGLVMIQAMACGIPVIASAVGGIPEVVRHGSTGLLARAQDPAAVAQLIGTLLTDSDRRCQLGLGALQVARGEHDAELYARRHRALYESLLPLPRRP